MTWHHNYVVLDGNMMFGDDGCAAGTLHDADAVVLPKAGRARPVVHRKSPCGPQVADRGNDVVSRCTRRVIKYAKFVEAQHEREEAPGCEMCANNRVTLEKAWQVANATFFNMPS